MKTVSISDKTHELISGEIERIKKEGTVPPTIGQIVDAMSRVRYQKQLAKEAAQRQAREPGKPEPHETTNT